MVKKLILSSMMLGGLCCAWANPTQTKKDTKPYYATTEYSKQYTDGLTIPETEPGVVLYVSFDGDDQNSGTEKAPLKTIQGARDFIRKMKRVEGLPKGGVLVLLQKGIYQVNSTINFSAEDSGNAESPIKYKGVEQGTVMLTGGVKIDAKHLQPVEDKVLLERLSPHARGKVWSIGLSGKNIGDVLPGNGDYGQLAMNGHLLQLAQYPNRGYNHIETIVETGPTTRWLKPGEKPMPYSKEKPTGGKFILKEKLSPLVQKEFERTGDMRAQGYFHNDWYFQDEPVGKINDGEVQLLHHTRYGVLNKIKTIPRRVRLINVLAELDEPGEWYFDKKEERLYVWPIKGFKPETSELTIIGACGISANDSYKQPGEARSNVQRSLLSLTNTSYLTFSNLVFENTSNLAVRIEGGEYNLLAGSVFRNGAGAGVKIDGGKYNGITGCDFYDLYSAFSISGGDFKNLEWCHNFATNNIIRNCRLRGYGVVGLSGVGIYFAHNLLHSMNGAVMFRTANLLMEYNEFYNIGYEMGDFNVAYCGAQWYTMNSILRYNFVHHLIEPGGHPITAFRNDDNGAGMKVYGNVFYRPGRASVIFHGFLNDFINNINMDSNYMWWTLKKPIDTEGIKARWDDLSKFGRDLPKGDKGDYIYIMEQIIGKDGWKKGVWKEEFPELEEAIDKNPWAQTGCTVSNNYAWNIKSPFHIHGGDGTVEGLESTFTGKFDDLPHDEIFEFPKPITHNAFKDVSKLDFSFKDSFKPMDGFVPIPFEKIGLVKDQFRTAPPDKNKYRGEIYKQFKSERSGSYNAEKVNARYPVPEYLK